MELSPRLDAIARQVPQGARLADIGTDHGYLPVWLLMRGTIERAIAADLREGPLGRARKTARQYGQSEKISFRLCDGLTDIDPDEVDVITIAGMGGETIATILEAAPWIFHISGDDMPRREKILQHLDGQRRRHGCAVPRGGVGGSQLR